MTRYPCKGILSIYLKQHDGAIWARVTIQHKAQHLKYTDISIPDEICEFITENIARPSTDVSQSPFTMFLGGLLSSDNTD